MIQTDLKKKKRWSEEDENVERGSSLKKGSNGSPVKNQEVEEGICKIVLMKIGKDKMPKEVRERKINSVNDGKLIKWIERAKKNIKSLR
jgi:hypothetical protein